MMTSSAGKLSGETYACASNARKMRTQRKAEKMNIPMSHRKAEIQ